MNKWFIRCRMWLYYTVTYLKWCTEHHYNVGTFSHCVWFIDRLMIVNITWPLFNQSTQQLVVVYVTVPNVVVLFLNVMLRQVTGSSRNITGHSLFVHLWILKLQVLVEGNCFSSLVSSFCISANDSSYYQPFRGQKSPAG